MNFVLRNLNDFLILGGWAILWLTGGFWIARFAFRLPEKSQVFIGMALGLIINTWLANLLTFILPVDAAFWAAAVLTLLLGVLFAWGKPLRDLLSCSIPLGQVATFLILTYIFTMVSRGLAIYDDYAHLPTLSMMAAGDLPPHFPLDPSVPYGYHYFLILFAAQWMRLGGLYPWNALDLVRGISFALLIILTYCWVERLTFSKLGGLLGAVFSAFAMGTRWILLLLPAGVIYWLGQGMELLGSGRLTGATLSEALSRSWGIEGAGPIDYPFAFANGINTPAVMNHGPNGSIGTVLLLILLLTFNRWNGWRGALVTVFLLAATMLISETLIILLLAGFGLVVVIEALLRRSLRLPDNLWMWLGVILAGSLIGFIQGGALLDIATSALDSDAVSYQTVGFRAAWPPAIVSAHLGVLSLLKPGQLIVGLLEIGPVILVLPLFAVFGWKAFRAGRWFESALVASGLISLVMVFVEFSGSTGVRNTSRIYQFIGLCSMFFVPLVWMWVTRKRDIWKVLASITGMVIMFGGVLLAAIQLPAIQQPVYSYFLSDLDVQMERDYWNKLEPDALIFDLIVSRSPVIFARGSNANFTWYASKPEWEALAQSPEPRALNAGGYSYAYFDQVSWDELTPSVKESYLDSCVRIVNEIEDWRHDFRKLLDISNCTIEN